MNLKIEIENTDFAVRFIERYRENLEKRVHELLSRLADIGIDTAEIKFSSAKYDGVNDVVVNSSPEWLDEHTLAVNASGESILFIEFGTGVYNTGVHPLADEMGMKRGEYGKGYGKYHSWTYLGDPGTNGEMLPNGRVLTRGNDANRCMWDAAQEMRAEILTIAREVFGND